MAPKRTLCGYFRGPRATDKKLRTSGSEVTNRWFAFYMKDAQLTFASPSQFFCYKKITLFLFHPTNKILKETSLELSPSWVSISMVRLLSFKYIHAEVLL